MTVDNVMMIRKTQKEGQNINFQKISTHSPKIYEYAFLLSAYIFSSFCIHIKPLNPQTFNMSGSGFVHLSTTYIICGFLAHLLTFICSTIPKGKGLCVRSKVGNKINNWHMQMDHVCK